VHGRRHRIRPSCAGYEAALLTLRHSAPCGPYRHIRISGRAKLKRREPRKPAPNTCPRKDLRPPHPYNPKIRCIRNRLQVGSRRSGVSPLHEAERRPATCSGSGERQSRRDVSGNQPQTAGKSSSSDLPSPFSSATCMRRESGWEGIRTPGGLTPTAVFKTAALDHSATHPNTYFVGLIDVFPGFWYRVFLP
jgi:hypothetical protein